MSDTSHAFSLNKIHSLAGLFAGMGALFAIHAHSAILLGTDAYNDAVGKAWTIGRDQTLWLWFEVVIFGIPLAIYGVMGLFRWWRHSGNLSRFSTFRNWLSAVQGWTGVFLFFFVAFHLWYVWRIYSLEWDGAGMGDNPIAGEGAQEVVTAAAYMTAFLGQSVFYVFLYIVGLFALAFHVANGLWNFGVNWGITVGRKSMGISTVLCSLLFGAMFTVGMSSLTAFVLLGA